jgi:hypothetical protein
VGGSCSHGFKIVVAKYLEDFRVDGRGTVKIILEAGCVVVKWVWLVRVAVLWLAVLMTVMPRCV